MKLKRVQIIKTGEISLALLHNDNWVLLKKLPAFTDNPAVCEDLVTFLQNRGQIEKRLYAAIKKAGTKCLESNFPARDIIPFRPALYRDFMLSEEHVINSSRAFARVLFPKMKWIFSTYEAVTRQVFPAFRPAEIWYRQPVYYKGNHLNFVTDNDRVTFPDYATLMDYELELGMIIIREILNATPEQAREAVGAFCVFNDFSARNVQYEEMKMSGFGPCKAKDFANSISAVVVTVDEIWPVINSLDVRVFINDKLIAKSRTGNFYHSVEEAVAYASRGERVRPGEFMATGTIAGCCGMENGTMLNRGDVIRLEIDGIGTLTNTVE